jgi:hypothetical protein
MSNVTLRASDLYSKHGFGDGDMIIWVEGIDLRGVDCQRVLVHLVREHLLPSLPEPIEVDDSPAYEMHNPIRAADWDYDVTCPPNLLAHEVAVPLVEVQAVIDRLAAEQSNSRKA